MMPSRDRLLALTFDDGPNDVYTPALLDILEQNSAKATFFLVGKHVCRNPAIVRRIHAEGHAIGNHTFTHPEPPGLVGFPPEAIRKELLDCKNTIEDALGIPAEALLRPPYGRIDTTGLYVAGAMSLAVVNWSIDAEDWVPKPAQSMASMIKTTIDGRMQDEIILLHDGSPGYPPEDRSESIQTARLLLEGYATLGHRFVTLPDLIRSRDKKN